MISYTPARLQARRHQQNVHTAASPSPGKNNRLQAFGSSNFEISQSPTQNTHTLPNRRYLIVTP